MSHRVPTLECSSATEGGHTLYAYGEFIMFSILPSLLCFLFVILNAISMFTFNVQENVKK